MFYKVSVTSASALWLQAHYRIEAPTPDVARAAGIAMATDDYGQREYQATATAFDATEATATTVPAQSDSLPTEATQG